MTITQNFLGVAMSVALETLAPSSTAAATDAENFGQQAVGNPVQSCGSGVNADAAHDAAVEQRVNKYIDKVNKEHPDWTQGQKLEQAWAENIKERENNPTDTVGRDADYYLAARKEVANSQNDAMKAGKSALGPVAWAVYSLLKLGSQAAGHPEWLRTDPDKPNAPVGGFMWMNRGSKDGFDDHADEKGDVKPLGGSAAPWGSPQSPPANQGPSNQEGDPGGSDHDGKGGKHPQNIPVS